MKLDRSRFDGIPQDTFIWFVSGLLVMIFASGCSTTESWSEMIWPEYTYENSKEEETDQKDTDDKTSQDLSSKKNQKSSSSNSKSSNVQTDTTQKKQESSGDSDDQKQGKGTPEFDQAWPVHNVEKRIPFSVSNASLGSWVRYRIRHKQREKVMQMKYAFVGKDGSHYWIEKTVEHGEERNQFRLLVQSNGEVLQAYQNIDDQVSEVDPDQRFAFVINQVPKGDTDYLYMGNREDAESEPEVSNDRLPSGNWFEVTFKKNIPLKLRINQKGLLKAQNAHFEYQLVDHGTDQTVSFPLEDYQ